MSPAPSRIVSAVRRGARSAAKSTRSPTTDSISGIKRRLARPTDGSSRERINLPRTAANWRGQLARRALARTRTVDPFLTMEVLYQLSYEGAVPKRSGSRRNASDAPHGGRSAAEWRGQDSNLRRQSQRIYSPSPLTAREPRQGPGQSSDVVAIASGRSPAPARVSLGPRPTVSRWPTRCAGSGSLPRRRSARTAAAR